MDPWETGSRRARSLTTSLGIVFVLVVTISTYYLVATSATGSTAPHQVFQVGLTAGIDFPCQGIGYGSAYCSNVSFNLPGIPPGTRFPEARVVAVFADLNEDCPTSCQLLVFASPIVNQSFGIIIDFEGQTQISAGVLPAGTVWMIFLESTGCPPGQACSPPVRVSAMIYVLDYGFAGFLNSDREGYGP